MIRFGASARMEEQLRCHCYGGSTDTSSYAQAVADTKTNSITQGKQAIDAIFGGGKYGTGVATTWDPSKTYYDSGGNVYNPATDETGYKNFLNTYYTGDTAKDSQYHAAKGWVDTYKAAVGKVGQSAVDAALTNTANAGTHGGITSAYSTLLSNSGINYDPSIVNQYTDYNKANTDYSSLLSQYGNYLTSNGKLYTGTSSGTGFNDAFYNKRATDYVNYAMPQLATQEQKTERDLAYNMANRGLLNSGVYNNLLSSLSKEVATQKQGIVDTGQSQANTLKSDVASQKSSLYSQLESSADTSAASSLALSQASSLQSPATYSPISNLLSNWANTYLNSLSSTSSSTGSVSPYYYNKTYSAGLPSNTVSSS